MKKLLLDYLDGPNVIIRVPGRVRKGDATLYAKADRDVKMLHCWI